MPVAREPLDPRTSLWHWLAFQLRYLREKNDMTLAQAGSIIGAARSTVSNIEAGRLRIDDRQAFLLDQHYGTGFLLQLLLHYARLGHDPEWMQQYARYEAQAEIIKIYAGSIIPGPFQTEGYMRGLLEESLLDTEAEVANRMARQATVLGREDAPWVWVLIEEAAIEIPVIGRSVMREQLDYLLKVNNTRKASVRIIPRSAGHHPGTDGVFRVISLESRDVAYAGAKHGGRLIEEPTEVRRFSIDFDRTGRKALSEDDTNARIVRQLEAFS